MKRYDAPSALSSVTAAAPPARAAQRPRLRPARSMLALETRIVFDGAVAATLTDPHDGSAGALHQPAIAGRAIDAGRASAEAARSAALAPERAPAETVAKAAGPGTIVFVDASVSNPQALLAGLKPGVEVVMLDKNRDGVQQIADALKGRHGLESIQIISEGSTGRVILGSSVLSDNNIDHYQSALATWGGALRSGGDILLFGCNVANNPTGDHFINRLATLTGADVAASTDSTGAAALGGNWVLEKHTGQIEADKAISERALADYAGLLLSGNGTADGTYDFGGTYGSASGGFRPLADKLKVSDFLAQDSTILYASNPASTTDGGSVTAVFKAEGSTVAKTFTFKDFGFSVTSRGAGLNTRTVDQLVVVLADASGNTIATLQMAGPTLTLSTTVQSLSSLINSGTPYNYANVASVSITISLWKTTDHGGDGGAASEINFESMTMSNISAAVANTAPVFVGATTALTVAQNGGATDIKGLLHINDVDVGQTETWTQSQAPLHGTLTFSGATGSSGSTDITPGGTITYTPTAGYAGTDTFTIRVNDGVSTVDRIITVNVTPAAPGAPDLAAGSDSGSNSDNITNAASLSFSGSSSAGDSASTVRVFIDANNNGLYDAGTEATATATVNNGSWSVSGLSTSGLADGAYNVYAITTSATGSLSSSKSAALNVTIDKTSPGMPSNAIVLSTASDSGSSNADGRTNVTNPTVRISLAGTNAAAGDTAELLLGGASLGTPVRLVLSGTDISNGYVDMSVSSGDLGADGSKVLTAKITDVAGNIGTAGGSLTITLDTTVPGMPSNPIVLATASDSGSSNADGHTSVTNPTVRISLTGTNAVAGDTAELLLGGNSFGTPLRATLSNTDISNGFVDLTVVGGSLGADGSKVLTAKITDVAGNIGTAGGSLTITLDTAIATPSTPVLNSASDSGSSNSDRITNVATPTISGTAENGSSVTLYDSDGITVLGTTVATGGAWSITSSALSNGVHNLKAQAIDAAGNASILSGALSIIIDTSAPATPATPTLDPASDSGASNADGITSVTTPTINGTAEAGSTVTLYDTDGVTVLGTTVATGGVWSITSSALADGEHKLTVKARDTAGNVSAASGQLSVTIATVGVAPAALALDAASDSGISNADRITNVSTPTISGTAQAGAIVTLYDTDGTTVLGTTVATGGVWSITSSALGQGLHRLSAKAFDVVGNTSPASTTLNVTIDTSAPAAPAALTLDTTTDSGASNSDGVTKFGNLLINGSGENGSIVTLYDSDGVTVLGSTVVSGGLWHITTSSLADGGHTLHAIATDVAGNASAASATLNVTVDTSIAAPATPTLDPASDSGASNADGITRITTPTLSGTAENGSTVTLYDDNGVTVLGTAVATGGTWRITSSALADGVHRLTVKATDTAGNISAASGQLAVTIDTSAPAAPATPTLDPASDSGASNTDGITSVTTPTLSGTAENGSTVTLYDDNGVTVLGTAVATGGTWRITSSALADGEHRLTVKATDTAGNISAASGQLSVTIDTSAPAAPATPTLDPASDSGASNADRITRITTPTLSGTAEAGSTITLYDDNGVTVLGTTVATGGTWRITSSALADGEHRLTVKATDTAGNISAASGQLVITIDATAPSAPATPTLDAASDSGASNADRITSVTTPTLSGTAENGSTVTLYDDDGVTVLGTAVATGGTWRITSSALADGEHRLTVKATDTAGNISAASGQLAVTIDATAPAAPATPTLDPASDSGASNADGITRVTTPTISGKAENGSTVTLYDDDGVTVLGTTVATGGAWRITSSALTDGVHRLTVRATDTAGNISAASGQLAVTIDATAPAAPATPTLDPASDSGASNADGITRVTTPTISGTAEAGSTITLYDDDGVTVLGTTVATGGAWRITSSALADGVHRLTVKATDTAGNISAASGQLVITIDATAPAAPATPTLDPASDSGASNADGITRVTTPTISGTAENGSTVTLYDDDGVTVLGTTVATGGAWRITSSALTDGVHRLTAKATDMAGNISAASGQLVITIDTTAPAAPAALTLDTTTDSGASNSDGVTKFGNLLINGSGENGSMVTLYDSDGVTVLGSTVVSGGRWHITTSSLADGGHTLRAIATDVAGNASAASATLNVTVDTSIAAPATPTLDAASDSGASNADGITGVTTPVISGTAEAGSTVTLYDTDGVTVLGSTVATGGVWSITSSTLAQGTHTLTAKAVDIAGNASAVSGGLQLTIDTSAPAAPPAPVLAAASDSGASDSDGVTNVTRPTITGRAESGSTVTLYDTDGVTVLGSTIATGGVWSITSSALGDGIHSLSVKATDTAGNTSAASSLLSISIDTSAPAAPPAPELAAASDSGASNSDGVTNVTRPTITGRAESGSTVTLYDTDGVTVLGSTVATGGVWSITSSALGDGIHSLSVKATDTAGNTSAASSLLSISIDTSAPAAPPAPELAAASDSGASSSDGVTNVNRPTITGRAEAGSTITLYDTDGVTVLGSTIATGGVWSITSSALGDGIHSLSVKATDTAGNTSAASSLLSISIDTSAPAAPPAPVLAAASDSGASNSDGVTNVTRPTITGRAESGSTVTLYDTDGVTVLGTTVATGGVWSITSSTLGDGIHTLTAKATDTAGNTSAASSLLSISIDTSAPAAPPAPVLAAASDSGASNSDGITNVTRPTITGRAESGSTITLYDTDGVTVLGTTVATGGVWSITSTTLGTGGHSLTARAVDAAGNAGAVSSALAITIDNASGAAPTTPVLSSASDSGASNSDGVTNVTRPTITGRAEAGSTVTLYDTDGVTVLGSTIATGGVWSITSSTLGDGSHTLTARAVDNAGNASATSGALNLVIDANAPAAADTPQLASGGTSTTSTTPVLGGNAEANSIVTVRSDGVVIGTVRADADGRWSLSTVLALGAHQITASATDAAGNTGIASRALTLNVLAPPLPETTRPPLPIPSVPEAAPPVVTVAAPPIRDAALGQLSMSPLAAVVDAASGQQDEHFRAAPAPDVAYTPLPPVRAALILNREIADVSMNMRQGLSLSIPRDTFVSTDGSPPTLTARLVDGSPLPAWIRFDPLSGTFSGTPPSGQSMTLEIEVVAKDAKGNEVKSIFKLRGGAPAATPPQASLSGKNLLLALGLSRHADGAAAMDDTSALPDAVLAALRDAGQDAAQDAMPEAPQEAPPAGAMSGQLAREAQRFSRDAGATLRHLAQL